MLDLLNELGQSQHGKGFTYSEIKAWADGIGLSLNPWEFCTLHALSSVFASSVQQYMKADAPPPIKVSMTREASIGIFNRFKAAARKNL